MKQCNYPYTFLASPLTLLIRLRFCFLLQEIQQVKTPEELENFMVKHGENIIDTLGAEVDRLEKGLKVFNVPLLSPGWRNNISHLSLNRFVCNRILVLISLTKTVMKNDGQRTFFYGRNLKSQML